jgi:hypothetical protein
MRAIILGSVISLTVLGCAPRTAIRTDRAPHTQATAINHDDDAWLSIRPSLPTLIPGFDATTASPLGPAQQTGVGGTMLDSSTTETE